MNAGRRSWFASLSALSVLAALATVAPASAAGLPDLVASAPSTTAGIVVRGHPFSVSTTVRNLGGSAAAASTLRFYLSPDRVRGTGDKRLLQVRQVARLLPARASTGTTKLTPPVTTPSGMTYVIACADDLKVVAEKSENNNCAASAQAVDIVPGATSADLIDKDLALGLITPDQALVDHVFAAFGDSRLPAKYRGDDGSVIDSSEAVAAAAAAFNDADAATRAILIPFLKAPAYPNTWENLPTAPKPDRHGNVTEVRLPSFARGEPVPHPSPLGEAGWAYYQHPHGVRIWFRAADQHQQSFARLLYFSMDQVWKLTTLMGRAPASDAGLHPYVDPQGHTKDWGDGGSGDLDIYLTADLTKPAITQAYPPECTDTPSFIVIRDSVDYLADTTRVIHILAHEFMHVLQFRFHYAHGCDEYTKLDEATAQWAIDYVVPTNDHEHFTDAFLPNPGAALWRQSYDGWPFELFLAKTTGPGAVAQIYAHTESSGPWEAVNAAVVGGLDKQWPDFAVKAWNQPPVTPSFKAWDRLPDVPVADLTGGALQPRMITLAGARTKTFPVPIAVEALTRKYDVYTIAADVGRIEYKNGLAGQPHAGVHALVQLSNGTWKTPQDWSDRSSVDFCRAKPAEDVKKLVVITTDSTSDNLSHIAQSSTTKLVATSDCLPETYSGTFSGTAEVAGGMKMFWSGTATFQRATGQAAQSCIGYICWEISTGSVTWHVGSFPNAGDCVYTTDPKNSPVTFGNIAVEPTKGPDGVQTYFGGVNAQDSNDGTIQCGDDDPADTLLPLVDCCVTMGPGLLPVEQDGWLLAGSLSTTGGGDKIDEVWNFQGH